MPPAKFSHVVYQTNRIPEMRDWYRAVLEAYVVYEDPHIGFLSYDDEHHRIAFLDPGPLSPRTPAPRHEKAPTVGSVGDLRATGQAGVHHVAFTFGSLGDLLGNYVRLKGLGIVPYWCINHGPTTSMYYRDPDGNQVELQIDNYPVEEGRAWMHSPAFAKNPIGVEFDPDALVARFKAGVPLAELVVRD